MQRQPAQLMTERGDARPLDRAEALQQFPGGLHALRRGRLEPPEALRRVAGRHQAQHHAGQIHAIDLGLARGAQTIPCVPQPPRAPGAESGRTPGPLRRTVRGHAFEHQRVDGTLRVVARHLLPAAVDHQRYAGHGERRLGDVRGHHHAAPRTRQQRTILRVRAERSVQRQQVEVVALADPACVLQRALDLARAGQETQHVTRTRREHRRQNADDRLIGRVNHFEGMCGARHGHERAAIEIGLHRQRVHRGRHHDHAEIAACAPRLGHEREAEVRVQAALVELVQDHGRNVREQRVLVEVVGQHALGDDEHAGVGRGAAVEADVPAHFAPEGPALFVGDPARHRARGDTARLQHDHAPGVRHCRRHACGLAGARRGNDYSRAMRGERGADVRQARINRQWSTRHVGIRARARSAAGCRWRRGRQMSSRWPRRDCRPAPAGRP